GYNTFHDSKGLRYKKDALTSNDCEVTMKWNEVAKRIDVLIAEDKYITQSDIDELIRSAKHTIEHRKIESDYDKAVVDNAKKILAEYGVDIQENTDISETKSPVEKLIEKAEAAGVPVETIAEPAEEKAVFMDVRDETFIAVQQVDEGIEYSVYASDLTVIDGGIWEMDEAMDLKSAAADLLATMEKNIVSVPDYDNFIDLADGNSDKDIPAELAKIKADVFSKINSPQKNVLESPAVNAPEKISVPDIKQPKSGVPVTYHFSPENVAVGGAKSKYNANIEAIKTLRRIEAENRFATPEEQAVMAKYVGWGGIPQAFVSDKVAESISGNLGEAAPSGWENEQKELLELLSPEEYKAARASTLTSFYTPPDVTDGIYQALSQFGFEGGNVLE
ncbi:MAG: N-6 DNA methylase, partial [Oscillospiraceae bacterium]|nr:N-6 DNA methylase [Oscillospiraceae bacterium]